MKFPQESVQQAKEIATKYKNRGGGLNEVAKRLFQGSFYEPEYGYNNSIKTGILGTYLHELKEDSDCFSRAGMDFLIARELGLKPKIFLATGMQDYYEGDAEPRFAPNDHTFISITQGNKEYIVDKFTGMLGLMKKTNSHIDIRVATNGLGYEHVKRKYSSLEQISEEKYIDLMEYNRSEEGAKRALGGGQAVTLLGDKASIQYDSEFNTLQSRTVASLFSYIYKELPLKKFSAKLKAEISKTGDWLVEEGTVTMYTLKAESFDERFDVLPHSELIIPYNTLVKIKNNFDVAARSIGRKTPLGTKVFVNKKDYQFKLGFNELGELTKNNGVNETEHSMLLEEIRNSISKRKQLPKEVIPAVNQLAVYAAKKQENVTTDNPAGLLHSREELDEFVFEQVEKQRKRINSEIDLIIDTKLAQAKYDKNLAQILKRQRLFGTEFPVHYNVYSHLPLRGRNQHSFYGLMDMALFQKENPLRKTVATKEQLNIYFNRLAWKYVMYASSELPVLELKKFRHGIKRIFQKNV